MLLSTLWHAVSVWKFDNHVVCIVKACIRGFLWVGNMKDNVTAKGKGGLGLIDPEL